jgi:N6-adenosine-specific RNA methylase IME4
MTRYRTIVADPPWPMGGHHGARTKSAKGGWGPYIGEIASDLPYSTMTLQELAGLPVGEWAEPDAHLYVWTVNKFIEETYDLVRAWGFKPSTLLTWCKAPMGVGLGWAHGLTTEHILFARRGQLPYKARVDSTWWQWKRGAHSAKPDAMLDMVETVSPGPYLELFARRARLGWDYWGNESLNTVELAA